jgi:hypothetical protein
MCAIDALGIAPMLALPIEIRSRDPISGSAVIESSSDFQSAVPDESIKARRNLTSAPASTGAYELLLRFNNGREELRLADHLDQFAREPHTLEFRGQRWRITATEQPSQAGFMARLVCEPEATPPPPKRRHHIS